MPRGRQYYHSLNWGGARPGSGRPKLVLPETVIDVTPQPDYKKPLDYLWARMNQQSLPGQYRDKLAIQLLPYFHPRIAMNIALSRLLDKKVKRLSDEEIDKHLEDLGYAKIPAVPTTGIVQ